jgi:hypothetical protein
LELVVEQSFFLSSPNKLYKEVVLVALRKLAFRSPNRGAMTAVNPHIFSFNTRRPSSDGGRCFARLKLKEQGSHEDNKKEKENRTVFLFDSVLAIKPKLDCRTVFFQIAT